MTKENQMRLLCETFLKTTGKTKKEFCFENKVGYHKYTYWERKFASESEQKNGFISIATKLPMAAIVPTGLVLEYPNGVKISIDTSDLGLVGRLIRLL